MIEYSCAKCGARLSSPESMIGELDTCPLCKTEMVVPDKSGFRKALERRKEKKEKKRREKNTAIVAAGKLARMSRQCVCCKQPIHEEATKCPHCQSDLVRRAPDPVKDTAAGPIQHPKATPPLTIITPEALPGKPTSQGGIHQVIAIQMQAPAPPPVYAPPARVTPQSGCGTAGLVLGIVGLVFFCIPGLGITLCVLGFVLSFVGLFTPRECMETQ